MTQVMLTIRPRLEVEDIHIASKRDPIKESPRRRIGEHWLYALASLVVE